MRLYMETTKIPAINTAQEIVRVLVLSGATHVNQTFVERKLVGLRWTMVISGRDVPFEMPVRIEPVFRAIQKTRSPKFRGRAEQQDREQAERVAWRQLLRWVQAQLAMIETGMVEPGEVFAAYMSLPQGTLYRCLVEGKAKGLLGGENA